jgi:hypothetical protein
MKKTIRSDGSFYNMPLIHLCYIIVNLARRKELSAAGVRWEVIPAEARAAGSVP